ncbi:pentapeptide repeat-containing protein [Streptomyces massasporeus]|uniref:pentapeptide repeat-containing protein n=1 Tax=Streptomyces massasporeus TaxID=67324 RepID=UPI00382335DB
MTFEGIAGFTSATFERDARFGSAVFKSDSSFDSVAFEGDAVFEPPITDEGAGDAKSTATRRPPRARSSWPGPQVSSPPAASTGSSAS